VTTRYRYRAGTTAGEVVDGVLEAPSRQSLLEQLRRRHLYPLTVEEVPPTPTRSKGWKLGRRGAVAVWARNFATLAGAAVPVDRALAVTTQQIGHDGLAAALKQVRSRVQEGSSIAEALAAHSAYFPSVVVASVAAGETSGTLDVVLDQLAQHLEEMAELRAQVRSALLYPALMAVVASIGVVVLLLFVVPRFTGILEEVGGSLPVTTQLLVWGSLALTKAWWAWLALIAALLFVAHRMNERPEWRRRWHAWRLTLPHVGDLEVKYSTARFARTLGMLLASGAPMITALRVARASISNSALAEGVDRAASVVAEGGALAPALSGSISPLAVQMLAVGEEGGRLEEMCARVADAFDAEVRRAIRTAVALIEPALILVFGVLVGFVALAMLQAIYSINTSGF